MSKGCSFLRVGGQKKDSASTSSARTEIEVWRIAPERDARRDAWMAAHGFTVLRFTNAEVHGNVEGVVTAIRAEVERLRAKR